MRLLDEQYTKAPVYGVPSMTEWLRTKRHPINRKRVIRLMRLMGLEAVYPRPWLSKPAKDHKKYPYLLKDVVIERAGKVWSTDITYIRLKGGFVYIVAKIDWHRHQLAPYLALEPLAKIEQRSEKNNQPKTFFSAVQSHGY